MGAEEQPNFLREHGAATPEPLEMLDTDITLSQDFPKIDRNTVPHTSMANIVCISSHLDQGHSRSAPWSAYSIPDAQFRHKPSSDVSLFAPQQTTPSGVHKLSKRSAKYMEQKGKRQREHFNTRPHSSKDDKVPFDDVKSASAGKLAGPTRSISESSRAGICISPLITTEYKRGGRRGALDQQCREDAEKMRRKRSCWPCVFTRGKVWR